jgi:hypothetical protein
VTGPEVTERPTGVCEICSRAGIVHRDHDHSTGFIRGILCVSCNHAIARLKHDPELAQAAADWLRDATTSETYKAWLDERRALAAKHAADVAKRTDARRDQYRARYQTDPEYREKKKADNRAYYKRAGL